MFNRGVCALNAATFKGANASIGVKTATPLFYVETEVASYTIVNGNVGAAVDRVCCRDNSAAAIDIKL